MIAPKIRQRQRAIDVTATAEEIAAHQASLPLHQHEGTVYVKRAAYGQEVESEEKIAIPLFATEVARVGITASTTRNLGDYNSARVEVRVELPCYPEITELRRAADIASAILDEIIPVELQKAGVPAESL